MVANNGCSCGSGSSVSSLFPFRGMPHCIPFDKKNTKTWKFGTVAALKVIGALNIARGKEFVIPVPIERNYCRGTVKVEAVQQKDFSKISS